LLKREYRRILLHGLARGLSLHGVPAVDFAGQGFDQLDFRKVFHVFLTEDFKPEIAEQAGDAENDLPVVVLYFRGRDSNGRKCSCSVTPW